MPPNPKLLVMIVARPASSRRSVISGNPPSSGSGSVALIEGAISRFDEIERLRAIRAKAKVLVAFGTCACYGGVNRLKNDIPGGVDEVNRIVYPNHPQQTLPVRPISEYVEAE